MKRGGTTKSKAIDQDVPLPAEPGYQAVSYRDYRADQWENVQSAVVKEAAVSLTVNGEDWLSLMCTPVDLDALAVGFLFNEGVIQSMAEIASVRVCPTMDNVDVWVTHAVEAPVRWRRTSGCTGGMTSVDEQPATALPQAAEQELFCLPAGKIMALVQQLFEMQDLYRQVGGVHTSALSDGETICVAADDIGRHNTLDKIAGRCLIDGVELRQRILITTGRVSSEMLQKAARIGAGMVITRTSPSSLSVQMAETGGITLIGYARRDRFKVYTHAERILAPTEAPFQTAGNENCETTQEDNKGNL